MNQDKMSQDEIDVLVKGITTYDETVLEDHTSSKEWYEQMKRKCSAVKAAKKRLEFAREYGTFEEAKQVEKDLHNIAFSCWLFRHNMDRNDYYELMNKEAVKKGLKPVFRLKS